MKSAEISRVHMIKRCLAFFVFVMGLHNIALAATCENVKCPPGEYWTGSNCALCATVSDTDLKNAGVTKDMLWCPGYMSDCDDKRKGLHTCDSYIENYDYYYNLAEDDNDWNSFTEHVAYTDIVKSNQHRSEFNDTAEYVAEPSTEYKKCKLSKRKCNPGLYMPKNKNECKNCYIDKKYCPGGWYEVNKSTDQGIYDCGDGKITDPFHKACASCPDGMRANSRDDLRVTYSIKNDNSRHTAPVNTVCIYGYNADNYYDVNCDKLSSDPDYNKKNGIWGVCDQEIEFALNLQGVDLSFDKTARVDPNTLAGNYVVLPSVGCDKGNITVDGQCVPCTSNSEWVKFAKESRMYCPGGLVLKDSNGNYPGPLKQLKKCPKYKKPNDNLDDCECIYDDVKSDCKPTSLSHKEIYYGPLGKDGADALYKQCWTKKTKSVYRKCMGFDD